jgi:hypothetical protein
MYDIFTERPATRSIGNLNSIYCLGYDHGYRIPCNCPDIRFDSTLGACPSGKRNAGEFVMVNAVKGGACVVAMTDLQGRLVYSGTFTGPSQHGIDTRGMSRGLYLVNVRNGVETFSGKVLLK